MYNNADADEWRKPPLILEHLMGKTDFHCGRSIQLLHDVRAYLKFSPINDQNRV